MRMGQGVRTGLGHGGITCVSQTQFSFFFFFFEKYDVFASKLNKTCHRDRIARLTAPCRSHKKL